MVKEQALYCQGHACTSLRRIKTDFGVDWDKKGSSGGGSRGGGGMGMGGRETAGIRGYGEMCRPSAVET